MAVPYREWFGVVDKTSWGLGEWMDEPDKVQWADPESSLPCLVLRGPVGSLNGYVGVPREHSLYGKTYSQVVPLPKTFLIHRFYKERYPELPGPGVCESELGSYISCHRGLTYSGVCQTIDVVTQTKLRDALHRCREESLKYPSGDAAEFIKEWESIIHSTEMIKSRLEATMTCSVPSEDLWWFGFDCSHAGDFSPKLEKFITSATPAWSGSGNGDVYRNVAYVKDACTNLAKQLMFIQECFDNEKASDEAAKVQST